MASLNQGTQQITPTHAGSCIITPIIRRPQTIAIMMLGRDDNILKTGLLGCQNPFFRIISTWSKLFGQTIIPLGRHRIGTVQPWHIAQHRPGRIRPRNTVYAPMNEQPEACLRKPLRSGGSRPHKRGPLNRIHQSACGFFCISGRTLPPPNQRKACQQNRNKNLSHCSFNLRCTFVSNVPLRPILVKTIRFTCRPVHHLLGSMRQEAPFGI